MINIAVKLIVCGGFMCPQPWAQFCCKM